MNRGGRKRRERQEQSKPEKDLVPPMTTAQEIIERLPRVVWFGLLLACGLLLLVARLWWMQVAQYSKYGVSGDRQSLRTIRTPAARGGRADGAQTLPIARHTILGILCHLHPPQPRHEQQQSTRQEQSKPDHPGQSLDDFLGGGHRWNKILLWFLRRSTFTPFPPSPVHAPSIESACPSNGKPAALE